jgi:flagellar assembly protein FliH
MNSSSKLPSITAFEYEEMPSSASKRNAPHPQQNAQPETALTQQLLEQGRREGESKAREIFVEQLSREHEFLRSAISNFAQERSAYFDKVEAEVVQLALALARKVLHREAQVDPLLLAGIVRVAMEKLQANTEVVVRTNPKCAAEWREYFTRHLEARDVPEVIEDASLDGQRCVLQTALGTTELGIDTQMKEIEQGLFDLMAQKPRTGV